MGVTPAYCSSSTTSFMTAAAAANELTAKSSAAMPSHKPSTTNSDEEDVSVILPALMLLEMEDAGDCSSSCCDEESFSLRSSSSSRSLTAAQQRKVGFANVQVREYTVTVGDHPCCSQGCALSLDWEYQEVLPALSLDAFESKRAAQRRHRNELRTSWEERRRILSQECSDGELRKAQRKLHRARSCNSRLCEKMSESFFQSTA